MTIKNLWPFLKKNYPQVFENIDQSQFAGYRVFIDAGSLLFVFRCSCRSAVIDRTNVLVEPVNEQAVDMMWFRRVLEFMIRMISQGITPVLVYDGPSPLEKSEVKLERDSIRRETLDKLRELMSQPVDILADVLTHDGRDRLTRARKLLSASTSIPEESMNNMKYFIKVLGIPWIQCNTEAERLCSILVREGHGIASFSPDGDGLGHGCPILIRKEGDPRPDKDRPISTYNIVQLHKVLSALSMDQFKLTETCIMSGCDYNTNIKNGGRNGKTAIGISRAVKLIQTYGSIDNLPPEYNLSCLRHQACRLLFQEVPSSTLIKEYGPEGLCLSRFNHETHDALTLYELSDLAGNLKQVLEKIVEAPRSILHYRLSPVTTSYGFSLMVEEGTMIQNTRPMDDKPNKQKKKKSRA